MQITQLQLALDRFQAARPYYPCCLLVHPDVRHLQKVAEHLFAWYRWPMLSIGTTLSTALLTVAPGRRSREAHVVLAAAAQRFAPGPLLCADIDLLFEPSLALDPLRLLRDSSRITMLIVLWPGTIAAGILAYAAPAHAHYRAWNRTDLSADAIISV